MSAPRRLRGDEGASLVLALAFLAVLALFVTASLTKAFTMLKVNSVVDARGELQYGADGGVELALDRLREDRSTTRSLCLTPLSGVQTIGTATLNGHPVTYTCETLSGFAGSGTSGGYGFAIITTSTGAGSLETQAGSAPTDPLKVTGSVYAAGEMDLAKYVEVEEGDVGQLAGPYCSGTPENDHLDVVTPGFGYTCTSLAASSLYSLSLPPSVPAAALPPVTSVDGRCRTFLPGTYTSAPALLSSTGGTQRQNYFASGVYYFNNVGNWSIGNNATVFAGATSAKDVSLTGTGGSSLSACGVDLPLSGSGATFILGGSSRITVNGKLQVNYRVRNALSPFQEGTPASVVTVPSGVSGWTAWSAGSSFAVTDGTATAQMLFNGRIVAPNAPVELFASLPTLTVARAGVVASRLVLKASAAAEDLLVTAEILEPTTGVRSIRVTSTAEGVSGDGGPTVNTAVVDIGLSAPYAVDVRSWRTN